MRTFAQKPGLAQQITSDKSMKSSRAFKGQSHAIHSILHLHSMIGNQAVQRSLQSKSEGLDARSARNASTGFAHDFGRILLHDKAPAKIQPKLEVSAPGDIYEREADRVAGEALRQRTPKEERTQHMEIPEKDASSKRNTYKAPGNTLNHSKGSALPDDMRAYFEQRMKFDFGNVRIHTDNKSHRMNEELGARALTYGSDIYFAADQFTPSSNAGKHLIAHELVHVMQQSETRPASLQLTRAPANQVSGAWTSLGSFSWNHHIAHNRRVVLNVLVGNRSDWDARLRNLDNSDEIWQVKGFMETASNPSLVDRSTPLNPARALNYQNNVQRAPNEGEILDFLRALYNLGENLDLADQPELFTGEASGITRLAFRSDLNEIISRYQGRLIQETSEQGQAISSTGISGLVGETGRGTVIAVIQNAAATAMKAIDLIASARQSGDSGALSNANAVIRNSGRTIRYTLNAHNANVAFNNSVAQGVFDVVWGALPGGGVLVSTAKDILKLGFSKMLEEATKDDEPAQQAQNILDQFIEHVRKARREGHLGSDEIGVLVESSAITGFEAAMR